MEFKLNKIDTDIRKKMQEETKEDKVHSGKAINVNKDLKEEKYQHTNEKQIAAKDEVKKRYITIDVVKNNHENIDVKAEKIEKINESNSKGRILDTTK
ncbi:MAG: hypothetical protein ABF652_12845 [Clostridium beijerinckii]